ncbi:uncharacterized protein LOC117173259 [Belonocnema kinseyi]|uniref:uncharacterized protein LOC117173259 n=1 Tax=Belonocnema kinseyi TaxID=2817044 RepID=UPI00143E05E1|nr:uncharacterized protein LOC117173259 [Belonocnema kinseyi]
MKLFNFWFIFFGLFHYVLGVENEDKNLTARCFKFTWLGPMQDDADEIKTDCSKLIYNPCFSPFIVTNDSTPPDFALLWKEKRLEASCPLRPGYVCIKHTYTYNNAVINMTHFCGKIIEDKTSAISSGCYTQEIDGHTIESCACKSDGGRRPCNSAKMNRYPHNFFLLVFLMQIIKRAS